MTSQCDPSLQVQQWNDEEEELKWQGMRESIQRRQLEEEQERHQRLKKELVSRGCQIDI